MRRSRGCPRDEGRSDSVDIEHVEQVAVHPYFPCGVTDQNQRKVGAVHGGLPASPPSFVIGTLKRAAELQIGRLKVLADEPTYRWTRWTNEQGTVLEFVEFDWTTPTGEGHCYPGGVGSGGCGIDTPIHYGEAALNFYIAHPKDA